VSRPTKAEQAARKKAEAARFQRIMRGRVVMLLWPADPVKGEQKAYCSAQCILLANEWDWETPATRAHAREVANETPTEWDPHFRLIKKGLWPLTRYSVHRPYAADVDGVVCANCKKSMRTPLTPQQRKVKEKLRQERQAAYRAAKAAAKVKADAVKAAESEARLAKLPPEEQEQHRELAAYLAMLSDNREDKNAEARRKRAWSKLPIAEKAKVIRAQRSIQAQRRRDFEEARRAMLD